MLPSGRLRPVVAVTLTLWAAHENLNRDDQRAMSTRVERSETGIERLLRAEAAQVQFVQADSVTWRKWAGRKAVRLWQAIALHSFLDPDALSRPWVDAADPRVYWPPLDEPRLQVPPGLRDELTRNLDAAKAAVIALKLPLYERVGIPAENCLQDEEVLVSEFHAWATSVQLPVVTGWRPRSGSGPWPWGEHTTSQLEQLASAAERFWRTRDEGGQYDPANDPEPKNSEVEAFLCARGVPVSAASHIASLLRPPTIRPGPRSRRRWAEKG